MEGDGIPKVASSLAPASTTAERVSSQKNLDFDDVSQVEMTLLTLRKPTELKKVIDCIPKPMRAVPKNGLPVWYKIGLESKLPVPKMPEGKIVFSRGKMGEDIRRIGLGPDAPPPNFDITDPYCYNVTYDYIAVHDPHLAFYFRQKPARERMKACGYATKDGRAICSLKEFNLYRKYLYNQFMDRIHCEMTKLDERAKDDLTLKRVAVDVQRRAAKFYREEKSREQMEKHKQAFQDEEMEKKRRLKEQYKKVQARMKYLEEFNKKNQEERRIRSHEKETRIKQRVTAAAEMELRRKITMVRNWRTAEQRRLNRLNAEREAKKRRQEDDANEKWKKRVSSQNQKIQEEAVLLKLYMDDMQAAASRRAKRAEVYAYNTDLKLQRIRMANLKEMHGGSYKHEQLVRKMGIEFEKSKRGAKGMSPELAQRMAKEAMSNAFSTQGDVLMTLGQARARMDIETVLPVPPIAILDQMIETAVVEFTRRRVHMLLRHVERIVYNRAWKMYINYIDPPKSSGRNRARQQLIAALSMAHAHGAPRGSIQFGDVYNIPPETESETDYKSIKNRPPTPVPSLTKLAEVAFTDRVDELPDAVAVGYSLPERRKLLDTLNSTARLLTRTVGSLVEKRLDLVIGSVTLPNLRHRMEWGEAVEGLADAVVNTRIQGDCGDVRRAAEYLSYRVLQAVNADMKAEKHRRKNPSLGGNTSQVQATDADFYNPGSSTLQMPEGDLAASQPNQEPSQAAPSKQA